MRALLRLLGLARSEPEEQGPPDVVPSAKQPPPGISPGTVAMLERMKRKVAKAAATSLTVGEARQVDAEIDAALAGRGGRCCWNDSRRGLMVYGVGKKSARSSRT